MSEESLPQYPDDNFQDTQMEDLESRLNNLINDEQHSQTINQIVMKQPSNGVILPLISLHKSNPQTIDELQNNAEITSSQVFNNVGHSNGKSLISTSSQFFQSNTDMYHESGEISRDEADKDVLSRMTEAVFDETSTINKDMITRHNKMQKLLAKRQQRVQKLAKIVDKQIESLSDNESSIFTATAVKHSNLLASDDEFSQDEDDHFINSDGEITKDSTRKEHNIHGNNRRDHLPNFTQKEKSAKEKRSTIKEKKAITFEDVTAAQNDEPLGLVEDSNKGLSALRLRISNTSDNKKAKSVKKSHSGPINLSHVEKTKINKNSVSESQCTNLCYGAEEEQSVVTKYNASKLIGTSARTQQLAYLSDPLSAQAQTHSVSTLNPTLNTLQALPTEANRLLLLEPKNIKDIVDALDSTPEPSQTQILNKRNFKDPGQTQSGSKNNGATNKDHCLKPSFAGEDEIPKSKKDEEVSKSYNETIDICENNKSIPSRDAYEQLAENPTSAEDAEDHEKYSKIYQSIQNSRLLEELVENEKELLLLEEMSKIEINKTKGKDKKALLDIAARTQELSIKYTRCEPILYSKLEVSKDSLLDEFSFSNGQFFPVKQKANKDVNTFTDTGSSQIDEAYQCNEFDIIDHNSSTDASEVVDLELEDEKKVSKNNILVSGKQFDKYFDSLKQEVTEAGNIELSDSDPDSGDVMDDGVLPNASSVLNKSRMFELKVKLAKKRKQKQLHQQKRNSLNTADIDVIKKEKNLNKQQIASLMMERHRRQIREQCSSDKKDNDDFGDFDIENEYEYGTDGNEDAEELTVRKLMQNEMVYNMRKADRLRTMKEQKSAKSDIVEDEDYEYEISSDEENDEDDETDLNEDNEGKGKEKILDIKNEIDGEPEISTQVKFNANNEEEHRTDYNDDEEDVVVSKVSKKKNVVLYDSDSEDADNSSTSVKYDNSGFLNTSAINNYIEEKDDDDDDCFSFNGGGLTQKIKNMFGNPGDDNKGNLTQLFEKSQEASIPQTQRITSTTSSIKVGTMNDNSLSPTTTAEDDNEYTFDGDSIIKGQHNESFVVGFDFDVCRKEEEVNRENETCIGATDGVRKNFKASNRILNVSTSKEKSMRKKGKLIRKTKTEGVQEEENEEDQFGGMTEDEIEKLRLQQNREMFLYEKNEEIKLRKKELKMKQKLGDVLDKEAEESDDEWAGLHGDEGNDDGDIVTNEDLQMIDNLTKNNDQLDGEKFRKLYADEELAKDQGILEKLQRDLESGQLGRRKTNRNYMEINDEGEDYLEDLQRREYLWRRRERQRKRLLEQQNVDGLSKNKKAKAFFASIAEETDTFSFRESIAKQYLSDLYAIDGKEDAEIQVPGEGEQLTTEKNQMEIDQVDSESRKKRKIIIDDHYIKKTLSFIDEDNEGVLKKEFKKDVMTEMFANNEDEDDDEFMKLQATSVFMKGLHQNRTITKSRSGKPKKDIEQFIELF